MNDFYYTIILSVEQACLPDGQLIYTQDLGKERELDLISLLMLPLYV